MPGYDVYFIVNKNKHVDRTKVNVNQAFCEPVNQCRVQSLTNSDECVVLVDRVVNAIEGLRTLPDTSQSNNVNSNNSVIRYLKALESNRRLPIFDNNQYNSHPVDFINQLEYFSRLGEISFNGFKYIIVNQFKGNALLWNQAYLLSFRSFEEFKHSFLEQFLSETVQLELKLKLQDGHYKFESFVEHFMKNVAMAKHLTEYSDSNNC